jgi:hypothetical protein
MCLEIYRGSYILGQTFFVKGSSNMGRRKYIWILENNVYLNKFQPLKDNKYVRKFEKLWSMTTRNIVINR